MLIEIGHVEAILQYSVKSMGGEGLDVANLGWHGLDGDRRLALRRIDDRSGFPWLQQAGFPTCSCLLRTAAKTVLRGDLPAHIRTPNGEEMAVFGEDLAAEVGRRYGAPVQCGNLRRGHSHRSAGGRADHSPPYGDREKGTRVIETQCPRTPPNPRLQRTRSVSPLSPLSSQTVGAQARVPGRGRRGP